MITDAMVEAGCAKYLDLMVEATGNDDETVAPEFMRAAIEAALAVQPVPTDAEIDAAIQRLVDRARETGTDDFMTSRKLRDPIALALAAAKTDLLRLIAAQREAAVREALEAVRWRASNLPYPNAYPCCSCVFDGRDEAEKQIAAVIDAELAKEAE